MTDIGAPIVPLTSLLFAQAPQSESAPDTPPLALHPENPHYFRFRGKPTVLITSGEHYGAVLNLDFDDVKYLDTLHADGLNLTRTFTGAYVEPDGAFNITRNTLAPAPNRFICPWARSDVPGYANGGNKFDLSRWDAAYFKRLTDFVSHASQRGIIVEVNLFCPFYTDNQWNISPMNPVNNINEIGDVSRSGVYTLDNHGGLLAVQEAMVRKIVTELKGFDNVFYEIMNEPYTRDVPMNWQARIADVIVETEKGFGAVHLISQNVANRQAKVENPHPAVSIFNFHYASPPDAVTLNYGLNKVIGDNETGFNKNGDAHYRMEAWAFILAGGGLYNNLDYSFAVGYEDGTFAYPESQPGGGSPSLRRQLRILSEFIHSFDFVRMRPDNAILKGGLPENASAWALIEDGVQYAIYVHGGRRAELIVELPAGNYRVEWLSPLTGELDKPQNLSHSGGEATLVSPSYDGEIALRIVTP
jgi:hypothetical protein